MPTTLTLSPSGGDDSQQLQDALSHLGWPAILTLQPGEYRVTRPLSRLDLPLILQGRGATLSWYGGDGVCLTLGFSPGSKIAGGALGAGFTVDGLRLRAASGIFAGNHTGLKVQNVYAGRFLDVDLAGFGIGLDMIGDGTGCTYNLIEPRQILNCRTSCRLGTANGGFLTETTFRGGRWGYGPIGKGANATHIDGSGAIGGIRWLACSFEGWPDTTLAHIDGTGRNLTWLDCRAEAVSGKLAVVLGDKTSGCTMIGRMAVNVDWQDAAQGKTGNQVLPGWKS